MAEFKVGDKVRIGKRRPGNDSGCYPHKDKGKIVTVRAIETASGGAFDHKKDERIYVVDGKQGYVGRFAASELEPCADTPFREQETETGKEDTTINGRYATNIFFDEYSGVNTATAVYNLQDSFKKYYYSAWTDQAIKPKKEKTIMSNIKDKIKVLAMSDDNKALHEAGFIDADGDLTDKGQDALEEVQYQTLRPELVKLARQLTEDDKKKEKKSK